MNSNQRTVKVNDKSIEQAGVSKDFSSDISEFIWNGFDAKANTLEINYEFSELEGIKSLAIKDNGEGIVYENLDKTFGLLLDSHKKSLSGSSSYIHGKKGIGRFSFKNFANSAKWVSVYKKDDKKYKFDVTISADNKQIFEVPSLPKEVDINIPTGCIVTFYQLSESVSILLTKNYIESLKREFGWFLHLNKDRQYSLLINGNKLNYESIITDSDTKLITLTEGNITHDFQLNYIEWSKTIGDDYSYNYFLDNQFIEKGKKPTSFNNNGINFHHSVYIVSDYFNLYSPTNEKSENSQSNLFDEDQLFKDLNKELHLFLVNKRRQFIERNADLLIKELEDEDLFPIFADNEFEQERKKEFVNLTKSLYKLEPKLFIKVNPLQKKSFLALLKLSVDSNERENILKIIESLIVMSPEDREELAKILEITTFTKIVHTMRDIIERIRNVEVLKKLVNEYEVYTNERDNIQKIMEKCFWLFGEQYTLISADKTFSTALQKYYIDILNKKLSEDLKIILDAKDSNRRPDLFLCRQYPLIQNPMRIAEDNLIVELKRPSVDIGIEQMRQIEDYMDFLISNSNYGGTTRNWKFMIVGKKLTQEVQNRVDENKNEEQFLYTSVKNYRVYAMNWDDLFQAFKLKTNFILSTLDINKEVLAKELENEEIEEASIPSYLTEIVVGSSNKKIKERSVLN